jgi:hypothetical protein
MKFLLESLIVFFGTLIAAALVALGAPAGAELALSAPPSLAPPAHQQIASVGTQWTQAATWLGLR